MWHHWTSLRKTFRRHFPALFFESRAGMLSHGCFPNPNQVVFVHEPNQTINTACWKLNLNKCYVWTWIGDIYFGEWVVHPLNPKSKTSEIWCLDCQAGIPSSLLMIVTAKGCIWELTYPEEKLDQSWSDRCSSEFIHPKIAKKKSEHLLLSKWKMHCLWPFFLQGHCLNTAHPNFHTVTKTLHTQPRAPV